MVEIELKDKENGYDKAFEYVDRYWRHNIGEDTVVALEISYDGNSWRRCNEIVSPYGSGAEWLNDWWEGEEHIRILGIKSVTLLGITGGIYDE